MRHAFPTVRREVPHADLDRLDNYCCTQQFLGTHPRGYPTIHLSKSFLTRQLSVTSAALVDCITAYATRSYSQLVSFTPSSFPLRSRLGRRNTIVRFCLVNRCREIFSRLVFDSTATRLPLVQIALATILRAFYGAKKNPAGWHFTRTGQAFRSFNPVLYGAQICANDGGFTNHCG